MTRVLGFSHLLNPVPEGGPLPQLEARLKAACREPFRRIDRFIQLALIGSAEASQGAALDPQAGLYVSTGVGPVGNNISVQESLIAGRLLPKPFQFVNTLGSSTGYYVSKNLGLKGQALFISRSHQALQSALSAALADMELGIVRQALVGAVEECTLPLSEHRMRQGLPAGLGMAEGSHWLLLEAGEGEALAGLSLKRSAAPSFGTGRRALGMDLRGRQELLEGGEAYALASAFHDSLDAALMTGFLASDLKGSVNLLNGNDDAGYQCWSLEKY